MLFQLKPLFLLNSILLMSYGRTLENYERVIFYEIYIYLEKL